MKTRIAMAVGLMGIGAVGLSLLEKTTAWASSSQIEEEWVSANHVRVRVDDRLEDFPLVPLADHLCRGNNQLFKKHCDQKTQGR